MNMGEVSGPKPSCQEGPGAFTETEIIVGNLWVLQQERMTDSGFVNFRHRDRVNKS